MAGRGIRHALSGGTIKRKGKTKTPMFLLWLV